MRRTLTFLWAVFLVVGCGDADTKEASADDETTNPDRPSSDSTEYEGDDPGECTDEADNDRDGLFDCNDPDCAPSPDCSEDATEADTAAPIDTGRFVDTGAPTDTGIGGGTGAGSTTDGGTGSATGEATDPTTGGGTEASATGSGTDASTTGGGTDVSATGGGTDPTTGGETDPGTGGATDPSTGGGTDTDDPPAVVEPTTFSAVFEILSTYGCAGCHSRGSHNYSTEDAAYTTTLRYITVYDGAGSYFPRKINGDASGDRMPPRGDRVSSTELDLIRTWIDDGAVR